MYASVHLRANYSLRSYTRFSFYFSIELLSLLSNANKFFFFFLLFVLYFFALRSRARQCAVCVCVCFNHFSLRKFISNLCVKLIGSFRAEHLQSQHYLLLLLPLAFCKYSHEHFIDAILATESLRCRRQPNRMHKIRVCGVSRTFIITTFCEGNKQPAAKGRGRMSDISGAY